jgi:hypothetical protein
MGLFFRLPEKMADKSSLIVIVRMVIVRMVMTLVNGQLQIRSSFYHVWSWPR